MASSPDASFRDFCEQSFHQVQPNYHSSGEVGEVDVITRVASEPRSDLGHLVNAVVVHHRVELKTAWKIRVDVVEEFEWEERPGAGPI